MDFSGRKFITVAIVSTYCLVIVASVILCIVKIMSLTEFLALISGLGTITIYIVKSYFDDVDRSLPTTTTSTTSSSTTQPVEVKTQEGEPS